MSGERTEKATPKKLRELRRKGTVARSAELPMAISFVALAALLPTLVSHMLGGLRTGMELSLSGAGTAKMPEARALLVTSMTDAVRVSAPLILVVGGASLMAGLLVSRSKPNPFVLRPRMNRISPKNGVKRLFGPHTVVEAVRTLVKLACLGLVAQAVLRNAYETLLTTGITYDGFQSIVGSAARGVVTRVAMIGLVIGIADAWWARRKFNKQAKMTKQEIKEEHKQSEGNPHVKGAIRAAQRKASRNRMIAAVAKADVVLANPTHIAVALHYDPESNAPIVVAKGAGAIAKRIKEEAAAHAVPIVENKPLARALWRGCEIGDAIPVELYRAVAEVLALVYAARRPKRRAA